MTETEGKHGLTWPMVLGLFLALPVIVGFIMIGNDGVNRFFTYIGVALAIAIASLGIGAGVAMPLRQWRRGAEQPETVTREVRIMDGTSKVHQIHYGTPPGKYLPAPEGAQMADPFAYAAMTKAAYDAGIRGRESTSYDAMPARPDYDMPPEAYEGGDDIHVPPNAWNGDIQELKM